MHDEVLVQILNGAADLSEQFEPRAQGQRAPLAIRRDRLAVDVFHDEIGLGLRRNPAIEQGDDVRMVKCRQDLTFSAKAARRIGVTHRRGDQLDGNLLRKIAASPFGAIDGAHAAGRDAFEEREQADALARALRIIIVAVPGAASG